MYKTKMVKVFLSTLPFYVFGLAVNLFAVEIYTKPATAQAAKSELKSAQAANPAQNALEPEILAEINRVRTNPQGYAQWLESQRQFYDGIWLKLPGEKPIRTNRGLKALEEAIAVLKDQPPLTPLNISEQTAVTATSKLEDFATANNIQNISYGRVTPEGIVMSIVVDELFPDRRRRKSLLSVEAEDTGIVCKPDPRYARVCAIAYSDTVPSPNTPNTSNNSAEVAEAKPTEAKSETDSQPENEASSEAETTNNQPEIARAKPENSPNSDSESNSNDSDTTKTAASPQTSPPSAESSPSKDNNVAENAGNTVATSLPQPAQPQAPPSKPEVAQSDIELETEVESEKPEELEAETPVENQQNEELKESEEPELAEESAELEESEVESELESEVESELESESDDELEPESEEPELDESAEAENESEEPEKLEAESDNSESVATNSDVTSILDNEERGALEEGDRTIPEDGSFYDSYPIQAKSGDSITIYLESDEFDPFVALIDDQGNIVEQNDDISEEDSNSEITVTIPQDGSYNIIVNAYDEGGKGEYVLTLSQ